jgi:plastocyanin
MITMTSDLHIFSRVRIAFACLTILSCGFGQASTVSGRVALTASHLASVRKHLDYSGVVVWLEPASSPVLLPTAQSHALMIQKQKTFSPHVLAVRVGTTVDFPNYDPIFHNAFSNYNGQLFDIGLYAPGTSRSISFRREGIVRVFCNIHPTMSAVIAVLNSPYFSVSTKAGTYQIADVPPGSYRLHVFHERATEQTLAALTKTVEVNGPEVELPLIQVSESGYLQLPHTNKYGKDYPPDTDAPGYPGSRP